jgi:flagellin-specific chaperone FliS
MPSPADIATHYSRLQIQTASLPKAICMLHERYLFLASLLDGERLDRAIIVGKAQNILSQLQASLIVSDSVSQGVWHLYDYCYMLLERGGREDIARSMEVMEILGTTFRALMRSR